MRRDDDRAIAPRTSGLAQMPWPPTWSVEGVIDLLEPMVVEQRRRRLEAVLQDRIASVTLVMDAPHDPHNGAAIIRSCDAFGVQQVHVVPRSESFLLSSGVTKGSERWVDVVVYDSPDAAVEQLTANGFELIATHPQGDLVPEDLASIDRVALVVGNEHDGIRDELGAAAQRTVGIPMRGFVESLNVSVSTAILLQAATRGRPGDLPEAELRRLYAAGLHRTVARAEEVLRASEPR